MAVIGWIKEEGSLVVLKEDKYLDSGVDEGFRWAGMRRAWAGKIRFIGLSAVSAMVAAASAS